MEQDCRGFDEDGHWIKSHKSSEFCPSADTRVMKKFKARRMLPNSFIRIITAKNTKAVAYEVELLKVSARNDSDGDCLYRNSFKRTKPEGLVIGSSQICFACYRRE